MITHCGSADVHVRVRELLTAHAAGALTVSEHRLVTGHLPRCADCREELAGWQAVRTGVRRAAPAAPPPGPELVNAVLARAGAPEIGTRPAAARRARGGIRAGLRHAGALLAAQLPLVGRRLWLTSALVMALGAVIAAAGTRDAAGTVLALIAPVVAAAGLAVVYGPDVDPGLELAAATPTSPRTVLLARLTLVFGYDLVLTLIASGSLAGAGATEGVWALVVAWFGPMALLSAVSLAASVWLGPNVAMAAAMTVWAVRLLAGHATGLVTNSTQRLTEQLWSTNGLTLGIAVVLMAAALLLAPRRGLPQAA